jgi:hypothetical protein
MPVIQPDTSEMTDFQASRPNTYRMLIKSVDLVEAKEPNKNTGRKTKGIQPTFEFRAPRLTDGEERTITRRKWLAIDGKGTFSFDQLLRCTGNADVADQMKASPGSVAFDTDALLNKYVNGIVVTTVYEGKQQDDIDSFLPAD